MPGAHVRLALAGNQSPGGRPLGALFGLALASCFIVAALVWQWSLGGAAGPVAEPSSPTLALATSLPPENPPLPAEPAPPAVQLAAAEAAPAQAAPAVQAAPPATAEAAPQATPVAEPAPQATVVAQAAPQDAAPATAGPTVPTAAVAAPDQTQLLQTMARDLANLQRNIEQLKAAQQQTASDNAKEIAALKASQEEMKRTLAKASEQSPPNASTSNPSPSNASPSNAYRPRLHRLRRKRRSRLWRQRLQPCASPSGPFSRSARSHDRDTGRAGTTTTTIGSS